MHANVHTPTHMLVTHKDTYNLHTHTHTLHMRSSTKEKVENIPDDESPNELVFADCES